MGTGEKEGPCRGGDTDGGPRFWTPHDRRNDGLCVWREEGLRLGADL